MAPTRRSPLIPLTFLVLFAISGCSGVSHNPSYFPYLKPFGDIVRTHGKPTGLGYYGNFDPHAVRVEVRPLDAVSPVRRHYVLIATVYDEKNEPRRNRRVEWLLEGAGNIIEVDESGHFPGRGYKVDNRYAVSYTNYSEHRHTRGTDDPNDDFVTRPGQSWCVISSAVEGDTHVTAYCPEIFNWQNNKVVVTTRWIDVEWAFPRPSSAAPGEPHVLTTSVIRSSDRQPLAGYRVRYRLLDGAPAAFVPDGGQESVAISDLRGNASVALSPAPGSSGVSRVGIELIRAPDPGRTSDAGLVLARGETTVDWQAPAVSLDLTAPPTVVVGAELPCTVSLTNTGPVASRALTIRSTLPENLELVRSDPPASVEGRDLVWTLGEVPGGQTRTVQVVFRTLRIGNITNRVTVVTGEGLRGEKAVATEVTAQPQPALRVSVSGPPTATQDDSVTLQVTVSNPGTSPATNVILSAAYDPGLTHEQGANPTEMTVGTLEPGMSRPVSLTLLAKAAGVQRVRIQARADGGLKDEAPYQVTIQRSGLSLENIGPAWRYAGRPATWNVRVKNTGEASLAGVVVRYLLPPDLEFRSASEGGLLQGSEVVWNVGTLPVEGQKTLEITATCRALVEKATTVAIARADRGQPVEARADLQIRGLPALRLRVVDLEDPIVVGGRTEYRIEVTNQGTLPSRDVRLVADLPRGLRALTPSGPTAGRIEGQRLTFDAVGVLAPGQRVTYSVPVEGAVAGVAYFHAELSAQELSEPVIEEETTIVLRDPNSGL